MSNTAVVFAGDTFSTVSRRAYGSEVYASTIAAANPDAVEPLLPGTVLAIPALPGAPTDKAQQAPSDGVNEVAILIDGVRFRFWSDLVLTRSLDAMDTLEFSAPFDPDAPGFRATFRPMSYKPLVVTVGGAVLFSGVLIGVDPPLDSERNVLAVAGYSSPAVLNDCTPPASSYPLEFNAQALPDIAAALCKPFGLAVQFDADGGAVFERLAVDPSQTVAAFLADLARQRSLVMSSTPEGALLFQQSTEGGNPVAVLVQGASPLVSVSPSFSPRQYHSHITGLESVLIGTEGSQYTAKTPHLAGVVRPLTFKAGDVQGGDIKTAVNAKLGRMYGNMVAYSVEVSTWRDPQGELWAPNTTVKLEAPGAMVYSSYELVVRSVSFERDAERELATLDLVLPGSFQGKPPERMPWD
ncbi:hypothetical protein K0U83_18705 [bacterium]|nr:hypothetical protein [bacterium]